MALYRSRNGSARRPPKGAGNGLVGHRLRCNMSRRFSRDETTRLCSELAWSLVQEIQEHHAEAYGLRRILASQDWASLCGIDPDYASLDVRSAVALRQILALFSKRADLDLGVDREAVTLEKFEQSEQLCRETDTILRLVDSGRFCFSPDVSAVLYYATQKISTILGECPPLDTLHGRFGPGSTTLTKKKNAHPIVKLGAPLACSGATLPLIGDLAYCFTREEGPASVQITPGRVSFVVKDWKSHRNVVAEAPLTGFYQLGLGDYIAKRLSSFGIDISDQTRNKTLAKVGSITGALATLDLKMASDTIASSLVRSLVPIDWWVLFDALRTTDVEYAGRLGARRWRLSKIASTGNGFTFPLETLIFYALSLGVARHLGEDHRAVSVYGDDIIVPTRCVPLLREVLRCVGFLVNEDKSFWDGPFRESCGGDFLDGYDIRPAYVRDALDVPSLFVLHNAFVRNGLRRQAALVRRSIDPVDRLYGPDGFGDGHLLGVWNPRPHRRDIGYSGWTFETLVRAPLRRKVRVTPSQAYVYALYSTYARNADQTAVHERGLEPDRENRQARSSLYRREPYECWPDLPRGDRQITDDTFWITFPATENGSYHRVRVYTLNPR